MARLQLKPSHRKHHHRRTAGLCLNKRHRRRLVAPIRKTGSLGIDRVRLGCSTIRIRQTYNRRGRAHTGRRKVARRIREHVATGAALTRLAIATTGAIRNVCIATSASAVAGSWRGLANRRRGAFIVKAAKRIVATGVHGGAGPRSTWADTISAGANLTTDLGAVRGDATSRVDDTLLITEFLSCRAHAVIRAIALRPAHALAVGATTRVGDALIATHFLTGWARAFSVGAAHLTADVAAISVSAAFARTDTKFVANASPRRANAFVIFATLATSAISRATATVCWPTERAAEFETCAARTSAGRTRSAGATIGVFATSTGLTNAIACHLSERARASSLRAGLSGDAGAIRGSTATGLRDAGAFAGFLAGGTKTRASRALLTCDSTVIFGATGGVGNARVTTEFFAFGTRARAVFTDLTARAVGQFAASLSAYATSATANFAAAATDTRAFGVCTVGELVAVVIDAVGARFRGIGAAYGEIEIRN